MTIPFLVSRSRIVTVGVVALALVGMGSAAALQIDGTAGDDVLLGTSGNDLILGLAGDDLIRGLAGRDSLIGGPGADILYGGRGYNNDVLDGGEGNDALHGSYGPDHLISRDVGFDRLFGGGQRDTFLVTAGSALVHGGPNTDTLVAKGAAEEVVMHGDAGLDLFDAHTDAEVTMYGEGGGDRLTVEKSSGGFWGGPGNDVVFLHHGSMARAAGPLVGGSGNDTFGVQNEARDVIRCGPGHDTVRIDLIDKPLNCKVIKHRISGDNGDNALVGTPYNDIINGFAGNDRISGLGGSDQLYGGDGDDLIYATEGEPFERDIVSCGAGVDTVYADALDIVSSDCENVSAA